MKSVPLEDLPQWSPWPSRLLGLSPWSSPSRTVDKVIREYDRDKYAPCLEHCKSLQKTPTAEDVRLFEIGGDLSRTICASIGDDLFEFSLGEAGRYYEDLLADTLGPDLERVRTVVELGAGYGYHLWALRKRFPRLRYIGGELSGKAVEIASRLYREGDGISVHPFNFYDPGSYDLVARAEPPVLVFTSYAVEQIERSAPFLDGLETCRPALETVVLFESLYEEEKTMLGLLRRRYTEVNDYNRDLLPELARRPGIRPSVRRNVFGQNPLHPISILRWAAV